MPPLRSNPNVIVPQNSVEADTLYEQCRDGELDGFQLFVHDFVKPDGGIGILVYIPRDDDPSQIKPALIDEGVTSGPLFGWPLDPTKLRHPYGYGNEVGSSLDELRKALIEDGRVPPTRRAAVADRIRRIIGKPIKYNLWRSK